MSSSSRTRGAGLTLVEKPWRSLCIARVSPTGAEDTIDIQTAKLRRSVELDDRNIEIVEVIEDEFVSGKLGLDERPGGRRAIAMICKRADLRCKGDCGTSRVVDEVRMTKVDRVARNLLAAIEIQKFLEHHGVAMAILELKVDTGTREGRLMFNLLSSIAEGERESIGERTMSGIISRAEQGKWHGGPLPFGLALGPDDRVVAADGAPIVREIFENVALNGATIYSEKIRTGLSTRVIGRILHNRIYLGEATVTLGGKPAAARAEREGAAPAQVICVEGAAPRIVSQELFDLAAVALTANRRNAKRNRQWDYLLSGQLTCAQCGRVYTGRVSRTSVVGPKVYYYCSKSQDRRQPVPVLCVGKPINGIAAEAAIWKLVQQAYLDPGSLVDVPNTPATDDRSPALQAELEIVLAALDDNNREREAVNRSIDTGRRTEEEGRIRLAELTQDAAPLTRRRAVLDLDVRAAADARALTTRALIRPVDVADELARVNATNDRASMRRIIAQCMVKAEVVTHLNRKKPFLKVVLAISPNMSVVLPLPRRADNYQQLLSVTLSI